MWWQGNSCQLVLLIKQTKKPPRKNGCASLPPQDIKSSPHFTFPLRCFTAENGDTCSTDDTSYFAYAPLANSPFG